MIRHPLFVTGALLLASGLALPTVFAQSRPTSRPQMTGRQVMERTEKKNRAADELAKATMKIYEKKTLMKERQLTITMKSGKDYEDRSLFRFESGDIRGTGFLTHQHGRREDDQWIYLPGSKKVKRLAASEKKESFVGSDYAYEDLRTENLYAHKYKLLGVKNVKAIKKTCYVVEARPATDDEKRSTGYSKRVFWISTDFLVRRIDYYAASGEDKGILKTQFFYNYQTKKSYKGFHRAGRTVIINRKKGTKSEFLFGKRTINDGVDNSKFSERELKRS